MKIEPKQGVRRILCACVPLSRRKSILGVFKKGKTMKTHVTKEGEMMLISEKEIEARKCKPF